MYQFIGYVINNNQYFFVGINDVVIERSVFDDGLSGMGEVGGFIYYYWWVVSVCGNQMFIGVFMCCFYYCFVVGYYQQVDIWKFE